jgi:hypothetical protein
MGQKNSGAVLRFKFFKLVLQPLEHIALVIKDKRAVPILCITNVCVQDNDLCVLSQRGIT